MGPKRGGGGVVVAARLDDLVGGELAQVEELVGAEGGECQGDVGLFALREGGHGAATGGEGAAALADGLREEPRESGEAIWALTEIEPADSPKMVTLAGSPPKAAMLRLTQASAASLVE